MKNVLKKAKKVHWIVTYSSDKAIWMRNDKLNFKVE